MFSWNSLAFLMIQWMLAISSLENKMATHSSILAWKIPWTEELLRLQSMGLQRVGHDWVTSHSLSLSSAFYKSSLNIWSSLFIYYWSLAWRILSITLLVCEMSANCAVVWTFFGIVFTIACNYFRSHFQSITTYVKIHRIWRISLLYSWVQWTVIVKAVI